ncbi:GNAT family N-acetyltransferase [Comamonas composti]|uniref:GNAT family N-acetyltransferase n=1 Tax=Comamonas composti TaxID=408558 RepID=UPI000554E3F3|nr:GNAT family N-acetyltransferase [Comamonas composti]
MPVELCSPRVVLRQWRDADYEPFAQLNADPHVMEHFPAVLSSAQSHAMADKIRGLIEPRGWGFWAAEHKTSGRFMGFIGLHVPEDALPFQPCVEIGWRLARPFWGQGLASEGARIALAYAFEVLQLPSVVAFTALSNLRSQAVMRRLGMEREVQDFDHPALPDGHALRRHCLYRLNRSQWVAGVSAAPADSA